MQHLFFTGEKGVGKSTLVQALLRGKSNIGGFRTVKRDGAVYLLRPGEAICRENCLFLCGEEADPDRFNTLGCAALTGEFDTILMDELGPREESAAAFQAAVFRALDGDTPVIGVLQTADSAFLRCVASHPNVRLIEVTKENRETLYHQLAAPLVGREVRHYEMLDSTSDAIKRALAAGEAPDGLVVLADQQTAGRGRRGRSFQSAAGKGLYCSVLLQPDCPGGQLPMITAWAAVAVRDAIAKTCGITPGIKWPNDLVVNGKKLCGILTELVTAPKNSIILGIGINLTQTAADFGPDLAPIAVSLREITQTQPDFQQLLTALLAEFDTLYRHFPYNAAAYLCRYRAACLTRGQVIVHTNTGEQQAAVLGVGDDFTLTVRYADGREESLSAGEVSVRGVYGYT